MKRRAMLPAVMVGLCSLLFVATASAEFGVAGFDGEVAADPAHTPYTQAGGHPYSASTTFDLNTALKGGTLGPDGSLKEVTVDLPPGLVGNPTAVPQCPKSRTIPSNSEATEEFDPQKFCPISSIVGLAALKFTTGSGIETNPSPVYNLEPPPGVAAQFGFSYVNQHAYLDARLREDGSYGISIDVHNVNQGAPLFGSSVTLWGTPADSSHDSQRCIAFFVPLEFEPVPTCNDFGVFNPLVGPNPFPSDVGAEPLITNPTSCTTPGEGLDTFLRVGSWSGDSAVASFESHNPPGYKLLNPRPPAEWGAPQGPTGCGLVPFTPLASISPGAVVADSPIGLGAEISLPADGLEGIGNIAQSNLKKAVVTLPEGMTVNPASAAGLGACTPAELAAETADSPPGAGCPLSSKIGTVEIETPLLEETLTGSVYFAKPKENPFGSLLALYLVVSDPERGVVVKLPGRVDTDPQTGRLIATFDDNPQLPFSKLNVELKTGSRAPLVTPRQCGTYAIETDLYPWARPDDPVHSTSTFQVTSGPNGSPCPSANQFGPSFEAGTLSPIAGEFSPLLVNASRPDGSAPLTGIELALPPGLTGKLAGVPYCSEAGIAQAGSRNQLGDGALEQGSPSCPAASQVGTVDVSAGAGPTPFHVQGKAYLAGPYKGAPLSLVVITPAVAGPFDLGVVAVRAALRVDPTTAQITAESDPIPQILHGIPLKIRSLSVNANKPDFTLNPTNCEAMSVAGTLFAPSALAPVRSRFQVGACKALDFEPKLSLSLKGRMRRGGNPALKAVLRQAPGQANIKKVSVVLPKTAFIDQGHISNPCTRVQFNEGKCPPSSILGTATAFTPLLEQPLSGPVYFRANGGERELPDLVADLDGQVHITLVGFIDCVKPKGKGKARSEVCPVRNRFAMVPDAPVSRFVLELKGGKRGLIENSANLCKRKGRATIKLDAQSGAVYDTKPLVKTSCPKKRAPPRQGHRRHGGR